MLRPTSYRVITFYRVITLQKSQPPIGTDEVGCAEPPPDGTTNTTKAGPTQVYPNDEATWGVLGTARSDATGRFRLPYASPGSYVLAVDAPATSVYGSLRLPSLSVSTGVETQTGEFDSSAQVRGRLPRPPLLR